MDTKRLCKLFLIVLFIYLIIYFIIKNSKLFSSNAENYNAYAPRASPPCIHTFDNAPVLNGYEGSKCLRDRECYPNLTCCYEKPGFELLPTSGKCRKPEACGPNTTIQEWFPKK